jgi:Ni/Co efflux regulator RcnB
MKHILTAIAVALSLLVGATSMARDGDGRRAFDRGHSHRGDGHRDFRQRGFDSRRHFDRGRGSYGDRRFDRDRRSYGDRKFFGDRRFHDNRRFQGDRRFYDDRRFRGDRKFYGDRFYKRSWRRGDRLPAVFLSTRFVVNDFRSFDLYRPPRGYRWVRVERDAFLTGVATGLVIAVVANRF